MSQDDLEAIEWFRRAADQGNPRAQFNLGALCAEGRGVAQEDVIAHVWFDLAASQASDVKNDAIAARDLLSQRLTESQRAEAGRRASEWRSSHPAEP